MLECNVYANDIIQKRTLVLHDLLYLSTKKIFFLYIMFLFKGKKKKLKKLTAAIGLIHKNLFSPRKNK